MRKLVIFAVAIFSLIRIGEVQAQEKTSGLQCMAEQLSSCKLTNTSVNASALNTYSRAFNCMKYGSTSGTNFNFSIPIPEVGPVGFGYGNSAQYSTEICREEIKKLESSSFVKTYSEVFSADCGKTLAGQYEQCLAKKVELEKIGTPAIQSLQCNAVQSSRNMVINLRYTPAVQEVPSNYTVSSVGGVAGLSCEKGVVPGIYSPTSMHCEVPQNTGSETIIVRLANTVSCQVPLRTERAVEISSARKNSCASVLGKPNILGDLEPIVRMNAIGMCDSCLAANLETPDSDQRTLASRLRGCLVWATQNISGTSFCSAPPMSTTGTPGFSNPFDTASIPTLGSPIGFVNPFQSPADNQNAKWGHISMSQISPLKCRSKPIMQKISASRQVILRFLCVVYQIPKRFLLTIWPLRKGKTLCWQSS